MASLVIVSSDLRASLYAARLLKRAETKENKINNILFLSFTNDVTATATQNVLDAEFSQELEAFGPTRATHQQFQSLDKEYFVNEFSSSNLVLNYLMPYENYGSTILEAAIEAKCHYIDMLEDAKMITSHMKNFHEKALDAGVCAVPGFSLSPGVTNILTSYLIHKMDSVESCTDICLCFGYGYDGETEQPPVQPPTRSFFKKFKDNVKGVKLLASAKMAKSGGRKANIMALGTVKLLTTGANIWKKGIKTTVPALEPVKNLFFPNTKFNWTAYCVPKPEPETMISTFPRLKSIANTLILGEAEVEDCKGLTDALNKNQIGLETAAIMTEINQDDPQGYLPFASGLLVLAKGQIKGATSVIGIGIKPDTILTLKVSDPKAVKEMPSRKAVEYLDILSTLVCTSITAAICLLKNNNAKGVVYPEQLVEAEAYLKEYGSFHEPAIEDLEELIKVEIEANTSRVTKFLFN